MRAALVGLAETLETDLQLPSLVPDDALRAAIKAQLGLPASAQLTRSVMQKTDNIRGRFTGDQQSQRLTICREPDVSEPRRQRHQGVDTPRRPFETDVFGSQWQCRQ